jgi:hypothetical protein
MQITIDLQPETGARFAAEAERRGISLDRLLSETLENTAAAQPLPLATAAAGQPEDSDRRRQAVEAMLGFAEKYGVTTGGQDLKSMIHEGHKY